MESNDERVNTILNHFKELLIENNNLNITQNDIYNYLINTIEDDNNNINKIIKSCNRKYGNIKYKDNIFKSKNTDIKCINPIKIYLPTDYMHIDNTINKILNFFNKKNTGFEMKVTNKICNNDISLRLSSIKDVNKFLIFIKNNKKINEGLINTNPFCYVENNLSFAIDGNLSYISIISNYIYDYLNSKKNDLDNISTDDFYNYIIDTYNNAFINFTKYKDLKIPGINNPNEEEIFNYKKITELILKVSEKKFNRDTFEEHFNECNDTNIVKEEKNCFLALNTLINYIRIEKQYKSDSEILDTLKKYFETDNLSYITNKGFFRTTIYLTKFKESIEKILKNNNLSLEQLISNLNIETYNKLNDDEIDELINQNKELYTKYLNNENIKIYLATNDYTLLSRKNNLRNTIVNSNFRNNLLNILYSKNISLNDFIIQFNNMESKESINNDNEEIEIDNNKIEEEITSDQIIDEKNIDEETIIEDYTNIDDNTICSKAIFDTYNKYQSLYDENKIECDGFTLVNYALTNAIKNNDFSSFTRDNDSRINLAKLGNKKILEIICNNLEYNNIDLTNLTDDQLKHIITEYLDNILFEKFEKRKGL